MKWKAEKMFLLRRIRQGAFFYRGGHKRSHNNMSKAAITGRRQGSSSCGGSEKQRGEAVIHLAVGLWEKGHSAWAPDQRRNWTATDTPTGWWMITPNAWEALTTKSTYFLSLFPELLILSLKKQTKKSFFQGVFYETGRTLSETWEPHETLSASVGLFSHLILSQSWGLLHGTNWNILTVRILFPTFFTSSQFTNPFPICPLPLKNAHCLRQVCQELVLGISRVLWLLHPDTGTASNLLRRCFWWSILPGSLAPQREPP